MSWERLAIATIGLPVSGLGDIAVAKGAYTDIVDIVAPSSAPAGSTVSVTIKVKNLWTDYMYISTSSKFDNTIFYPSPEYATVGPGATKAFTGSFTMPTKKVSVYVWSWYWVEEPNDWYQDDYRYVDIALAEAVWQKLATKTITITPIGWQKLATKTVTITPIPVEWVKLATKTIQITPVAVEWQKLASKTVTITPEEVPWEPVYQHEYPRGETYVGKAEECTATLTITLPEQLFPNSWVVEKIADTFADEVAKEGGEMLDIKIYEDATPTWQTDYKIVATAIASPFPWLLVIPLILAIILVVAFIKLVIEFKDIDWGEIPAPIPWAILALAGGLGVLGVGAAVALAMPRK